MKEIFKNFLPQNFYFYLVKIKRKTSILKFFFYKIFLKKKFFIYENKKKIFSIEILNKDTFDRANNFHIKEPDTIDWINNFEERSFFLDIGANIGVYSLYAATKNHTIISLEPEALNFAALNINIFNNNFNNTITAYPISANHEYKLSTLNLKKMNFGKSGHTFDRNFNQYGQKNKIDFVQGSVAYEIDKLLDEIKFKPRYIKIDVDGNELWVIKGMKKTIESNYLKSILIELNLENKEHLEAFNLIKENFIYSKIPLNKKYGNFIFFK